MLTQLPTVLARLRMDDNDDDAFLTRLIVAASGAAGQVCNRLFDRTENDVEEFRGDMVEIRPRCYPIEGVWSFDLKLNEATGWQPQPEAEYIIRKNCVVSLVNPLWGGLGRGEPPQARMTYTGGYVLPGAAVADGQTALPGEVENAVIEQVVFWYQNRDRLGLKSVSGGGGGGAITMSPDTFLPQVTMILKQYTRWSC
jgi:hypothetical protein